MKLPIQILFGTSCVLILSSVILVANRPKLLHYRSGGPPTPLSAARKAKGNVDLLFATSPRKAKAEYLRFVESHRSDSDPAIQDEVGNAEIRLGYLAAQGGDFASGRLQFQRAAKIKGTGISDADFGSVPDQAAYQSIVCLVAEHKEIQARDQFRAFIKDRPLSPLVHAAFRRLKRLNKNHIDPGDEALLQSAINKQEAHIRFETSVCGPKTLEYLLERGLIRPKSMTATGEFDYKRIAKLCKSTDRGTSMQGLRDGLKSLGIPSYGAQVNRRDFAQLTVPAIYLVGDHYLALLSISRERATAYDSRVGATTEIRLPPLNDTSFVATILAFQPPMLSEETN